ncbi:PAS domain S-box protein, partial [Candidatus Omnitrophota bacterium]
MIKRDITKRKLAGEALRESKGKYHTLANDVLDTSLVGMFILDSDFRIAWANRSIELYFGLQRDKVVGKDKRQLIQERIKDIFEGPESFTDKVLSTYDNNTYIENFECHVLPDGNRQERWLEHWSQPIRSGLYVEGRVEHYTDITKHKHTEHDLHERVKELRCLYGIANIAD